MEGRIAKTLKTMALLEQPFIKDTDKTVAALIKEAVSMLGENIQVRRFERCACNSASMQSHWTPNKKIWTSLARKGGALPSHLMLKSHVSDTHTYCWIEHLVMSECSCGVPLYVRVKKAGSTSLHL